MGENYDPSDETVRLDYENLCEIFQQVPMTWLPGLLIQLVSICVARRVFKVGGLTAIVIKAEEAAMRIRRESDKESDSKFGIEGAEGS